MIVCPAFGKVKVPESHWVGGKGTKNLVEAKRFVCKSCGTSYVEWKDKMGKMKTVVGKTTR